MSDCNTAKGGKYLFNWLFVVYLSSTSSGSDFVASISSLKKSSYYFDVFMMNENINHSCHGHYSFSSFSDSDSFKPFGRSRIFNQPPCVNSEDDQVVNRQNFLLFTDRAICCHGSSCGKGGQSCTGIQHVFISVPDNTVRSDLDCWPASKVSKTVGPIHPRSTRGSVESPPPSRAAASACVSAPSSMHCRARSSWWGVSLSGLPTT